MLPLRYTCSSQSRITDFVAHGKALPVGSARGVLIVPVRWLAWQLFIRKLPSGSRGRLKPIPSEITPMFFLYTRFSFRLFTNSGSKPKHYKIRQSFSHYMKLIKNIAAWLRSFTSTSAVLSEKNTA